MMRLRFCDAQPGVKLSYKIERLADGFLFDNADSTFKATPTTPLVKLPEGTGPDAGTWNINIPTSPAQFTDGDYTLSIIDQAKFDADEASVIACRSATIHDGDDATYLPPKLVKVTTVSIGGTSFDIYGLPTPALVPAKS